jgi:hypothetical protein
LIQLFPPDDERLSLETCRGGKINTLKKVKKCVKLVENPQLPQDARSTEYKKLTTFICLSSWNLGASTFWNPQGFSRSVQGLLYLGIDCCKLRFINTVCALTVRERIHYALFPVILPNTSINATGWHHASENLPPTTLFHVQFPLLGFPTFF